MRLSFRLSVWFKQFVSDPCPICGSMQWYYAESTPAWKCAKCKNFEDEMYLEHGWYSIFTGEYSLKRNVFTGRSLERDNYVFYVSRWIKHMKTEFRWWRLSYTRNKFKKEREVK